MDISLTSIKNSITSFFGRYYTIIFLLYIFGGLIVGMWLINAVIVSSDDPGDYTSQINNTSFDEDTIKRLRELRTAGQSTQKLPVSGRVSPF